MSNEPKNRETADRNVFGDDQVMSLAEALLAMDSPTVQQLDAAIPTNPLDRRESRAIEDVVAGSVFGRPEPAAAIVDRRLSAATGVTISSIRPAAVSYPSTTTPKPSSIVVAPSGNRRTPAGQRVTVILAILFIAAFSGSVLLTILDRESDASVETTTEPTVGGVTTLATVPVPPTTPATTFPPATEATTTAAPAASTATTTAAATAASTTSSTAAALSSSATTAPATTVSSTTAAPTTTPSTTAAPTTAAPTTAAPTAPPTTAAPTTAAPTAPPTTQITLPDITFAPPTWQGTGDPPP